MNKFLQNTILALVVCLIIFILLYVNRIIYLHVNTFALILINFVSVGYVVLLIHRLIKHFENENDL